MTDDTTGRAWMPDEEKQIEFMAQMLRNAGVREYQLPDGTWTFAGLDPEMDAQHMPHTDAQAPAAAPENPDSRTPEVPSAVRTPHTAHTPQPAPEQRPQVPAAPHTAPEPRQLDAAQDDAPTGLERAVRRLGLDRLPEVVTAAQPPLIDRIRYSTTGEWTAQETGPARTAHKAFTYAVTVPITVLAYIIAWAVERPMRFLFALLCVLVIGTAAAQLPLVEIVVPDAVNMTAWL